MELEIHRNECRIGAGDGTFWSIIIDRQKMHVKWWHYYQIKYIDSKSTYEMEVNVSGVDEARFNFSLTDEPKGELMLGYQPYIIRHGEKEVHLWEDQLNDYLDANVQLQKWYERGIGVINDLLSRAAQ